MLQNSAIFFINVSRCPQILNALINSSGGSRGGRRRRSPPLKKDRERERKRERGDPEPVYIYYVVSVNEIH